MKKANFLKTAATAVFLFTLAACNFGDLKLPNEVAIKSSATYKVNFGDLGTLINKATESLDMNGMLDSMKSSMGDTVQLFDYQCDGEDSDVLAYLVHYPVYTLEFNPNDYLQNMNLTDMLNSTGTGTDSMNINQTISLPAVSLSQNTTIDIPDFSTSIKDSVKIGDLDDVSVPENAASVPAFPTINVSSDSSGGTSYTSIEVREGGLSLELERTDSNALGSGYGLSVTASVETTSGTQIATATKDLTSGGTLLVDLSGKELPSEFKIVLSGAITSSVESTVHTYSIAAGLSNDFKLAKVTGLTMTDTSEIAAGDLTGLDQEIDLSSMTSVVKSATISNAAGNVITITAENPKVSEGVYAYESGISITPNVTITGGISATSTATDADGKLINSTIDLRNEAIDPSQGNAIVSCTVDVTVNNATVNFDENGSSANTINIEMAGGITELSEAVIDSTSYGFTMNKDSENKTALPSEMLQYVQSITFGEPDGSGTYYKHSSTDTLGTTDEYISKGVGLTGKVTNTLCEIPVSLRSKAFNMTVSGTIAKTADASTQTDLSWVSFNDISFAESDLESRGVEYVTETAEDGTETKTYYMDMEVHLGTQVGSTDEYELTLRDIAMGSDYTLAISDIGFAFDFDSATINASGLSKDGDVDMSNFDLSSMLNSINMISEDDLKKIQVETLPAYIYVTKPDDSSGISELLSGVTMSASMYVSYTEDETAKTIDVLGTTTVDGSGNVTAEPDTITMKSPVSWPTDTEKTYTASDCTFLNEGAYSAKVDLADLINARPSGMTMKYSVSPGGAGGLTVYSYMLPDSSSGSSEGSESESTSIAVDLAAILKFKLNLTGAINFNVSSLMNSSSSSESEDGSTTTEDKDLLNRTEGSDGYAKFVKAVEWVTVDYKLSNFIISGVNPSFTIDDRHYENGSTTVKTGYSGVYITGGATSGEAGTIKVDSEDVQKILDSTYFNPDINIGIGTEGETTAITVPRSVIDSSSGTSMSLPVSMAVKLSGEEISIWSKSESEE